MTRRPPVPNANTDDDDECDWHGCEIDPDELAQLVQEWDAAADAQRANIEASAQRYAQMWDRQARSERAASKNDLVRRTR